MDESRLVQACGEGDRAAMRTVVEQYHRAIRQAVGYQASRGDRAIQAADIDDAVQEVFFTLFARDALVLQRWRGQARLKTYLCRIAERVAIRHFQAGYIHRGRFRLAVDEADGGPDTRLERLANEAQRDAETGSFEQILISEETRTELRRRILARLSAKGRVFYDYLFVQELDVPEIAHRAETNPNNVYQWKNRISAIAVEVATEMMQ